MTFGATFGRVFSPTFHPKSQAAASSWWLSGGIDAANCVAAYQPKGAASLSASYSNLASPGTYDAAPGTSPTWNASDGWIFAAVSSQYLTTGVIPASGWSAIVKYSNFQEQVAVSFIFGAYGSATSEFRFGLSEAKMYYGNGGKNNTASVVTGGVGCLAYNKVFIDGSDTGLKTGTWSGVCPSIYIGARNLSNSPNYYSTVYIQALAFYNTIITPTQVGLLTTAMNAL